MTHQGNQIAEAAANRGFIEELTEGIEQLRHELGVSTWEIRREIGELTIELLTKYVGNPDGTNVCVKADEIGTAEFKLEPGMPHNEDTAEIAATMALENQFSGCGTPGRVTVYFEPFDKGAIFRVSSLDSIPRIVRIR